jgi:hypothetical protein
MGLFLLWLILAMLVGAYANTKGRSFFGFFLLSVVLSPLIGFLAALIAGPNTQRIEDEQIERGERRRCPHCEELVQGKAKICRYCGRELPALTEFSPTAEQWNRFAAALKSRAASPATTQKVGPESRREGNSV